LDLITQEYLRLQDLLHRSSQELKHHQKLSPRQEVNQEPSTIQELQAFITTLQGQVAALQNMAPASQAAPAAATTQVVFVDMPQTLGPDNLIDYLSKQGSDIYKQGIAPLDDKSLTNGFNITANQTVVFTEAFLSHITAMGWNKGSKQITTFTNSSGVSVDIIKSYGHLSRPPNVTSYS
jgi:hypothetical protein